MKCPKIQCPNCSGSGRVELYFRDGVVWSYLCDHPKSLLRDVHDLAGYRVFNSQSNTNIALLRLVAQGLVVRSKSGRNWVYSVVSQLPEV